jgi:hypothetical protein
MLGAGVATGLKLVDWIAGNVDWELLRENLLAAAAYTNRVAAPELFDQYVVEKVQRLGLFSSVGFMASLDLTPEEWQRIRLKLLAAYPAPQMKTCGRCGRQYTLRCRRWHRGGAARRRSWLLVKPAPVAARNAAPLLLPSGPIVGAEADPVSSASSKPKRGGRKKDARNVRNRAIIEEYKRSEAAGLRGLEARQDVVRKLKSKYRVKNLPRAVRRAVKG